VIITGCEWASERAISRSLASSLREPLELTHSQWRNWAVWIIDTVVFSTPPTKVDPLRSWVTFFYKFPVILLLFENRAHPWCYLMPTVWALHNFQSFILFLFCFKYLSCDFLPKKYIFKRSVRCNIHSKLPITEHFELTIFANSKMKIPKHSKKNMFWKGCVDMIGA